MAKIYKTSDENIENDEIMVAGEYDENDENYENRKTKSTNMHDKSEN